MGLVSTWLNGIGLSNAVPTFQAAGIVTPAALAELDVAHFEALGISDPDDRRKLFYLVQRIKMAVQKDQPKQEHSMVEQVDAVISSSIGGNRVDLSMAEEDTGDGYSATATPTPTPAPIATLSPSPTASAATTPRNATSRSTSAPAPAPAATTNDAPIEGRRRSKRLAAKQQAKAETLLKENHNQNGASKQKPIGRQNQTNDQKERQPKSPSKSPSKSSTRKTRSLSLTQTPTAKANAVFNLPDDDEDDHVRTSQPVSSRTVTTQSMSSHLSEAIANDDQTNAVSTPTSKMQVPKTRRHGSKLQNPGKSARTGKKLSSIPAESALPMSPLMAMPASKLNQDVDKTNTTTNTTSKKSKRRQKTSSGGDPLDEILHSSQSDVESVGEVSGSESESEGFSRPQRLKYQRSKSVGSASGLQTPKSRGNRPKTRRSNSKGKLDSFLYTSKRHLTPRSDNSSANGNGNNGSVKSANENESWATEIGYLREDNDAEHDLFCDQGEQQLYDYDMRIRVIVRKRPVTKTEKNMTGGVDVIHPLDYGEYGRVLVYQPKVRVDLTREVDTIPFAFDNVFGEASTNMQIYQRSLRSLIRPFFKGQWSTVFAYGQTGSGKTYTMMGSNMTGINAGTASIDNENLGLYYLAALDIFDMVKRPEYSHLNVQVSLFEIYGGKLFDLLNNRKQIKCLEDSKGKVCFPGLTEHPVQGPDQLIDLIEEGALNRSTGTTSRNADSSRSHAVLQLKLKKDVGRRKNVEHGRLNFIDLAGSERGADTSSCSRATRMEGAEINTSLLALKEVIRSLATGGSMTHIPFRGSKLTQVLKDSFVGENSRCCMIACISPDIGNCEQTLNTLRYADRVKERDSESGALAASVEQPIRLNPIMDDSNNQSFSAANNNNKDLTIQEEEEEEELENLTTFQSDADTAALDDLLASSIHNTSLPLPASRAASPSEFSLKVKAGEELVATHRSVMSSWLSMVKNEMTLVNTVDADRDGLDEYLAELQEIQSTQLNLISKLRDSLHTYVSAAEGSNIVPQESNGTADDDSDDDSFEDLRD